MAFNINLGKLTIKIGTDASDFNEGMDDVDKGLQENQKKLLENRKAWSKWSIGITTAATVALVAFTKHNLTAIQELKNLAQASNISVKAFQQGAFAAEQVGISTEKYGDILKDVNDRIGDFVITGGGPMLDFFEKVGPKIGVTIDDFRKLSGQEALGFYISSLEKANLSQEEMTFFLEAMASDSTRLLPLFKDNAKALKEFAKQAENLGIGLDDVDVDKITIANQELAKSNAQFVAMGQELTVRLAPIIVAVTKGFNLAAIEAGGFGTAVDNSIGFAIDIIGVFADGIRGIQVAFKGAEIIARGFSAVVFVVFEEIIDSVTSTGNAILEGWRLIFVEMANMVRPLSDTTAALLEDVAAGIDGLKLTTPQAIKDITAASIEGLQSSKEALQDLLLETIPSQKIKDFVATTVKEFDVALADLQQDRKEEDDTGGEGGEKKVSVAEAFQNETIGLLEAMGLRFESQNEMQLAQFEREKEILDAQFQAKEISQEEHSKRMAEIVRKEEEVKRQITVDGLQAGFQALASNSKKVQKAMKAAAIVQALIKGKQAAVDAWQAGMSVGGPWAPVVAAAYTAASIAKTTSLISSIKSGGSSTSSGGGGRSVLPSRGGSGGGGFGGPNQVGQAGPQLSRNVEVRFTGQGLLNNEQVRDLIEQINEQVGDGVELITTGG